LSNAIQGDSIRYQHFHGVFVGTFSFYRTGTNKERKWP
jgi:hypothetical protein